MDLIGNKELKRDTHTEKCFIINTNNDKINTQTNREQGTSYKASNEN
jgi:hypothetical protein